jgi:hypothetical protein
MRVPLLSVLSILLLLASSGYAQTVDRTLSVGEPPFQSRPWHADFRPNSNSAPHDALTPSSWWSESIFSQAGDDHADTSQPLHAAAVQHSEAYRTRAKVHKIASFATLPLFAAELWLGQSIYNTPSDSKKSAHIVVGTSIIGLFAVNTVTGAWNLFGEGWHDTDGRTLRLAHGLLMMASDVGFVATSASGPGGRNHMGATFDANKATHRTIALTSIGLGTAGYLLMLFGNR